MKRRNLGGLAAAIFFAIAACSSSTPSSSGCVEGASVACACPTGAQGSQICASGSLGTCSCEGSPEGNDAALAKDQAAPADGGSDGPTTIGTSCHGEGAGLCLCDVKNPTPNDAKCDESIGPHELCCAKSTFPNQSGDSCFCAPWGCSPTAANGSCDCRVMAIAVNTDYTSSQCSAPAGGRCCSGPGSGGLTNCFCRPIAACPAGLTESTSCTFAGQSVCPSNEPIKVTSCRP